MVEVVAHYNLDEIDKAVSVFLEGVSERDIRRRAENVRDEVRRLIKSRAIQTGHGPLSLHDSVRIDVFQYDDNSWNAIIFSDLPHSLWFEQGTGIHGPFRVYIFPKGANKLMYFKPYGSNEFVRAHRVQGQMPHRVFQDGLEAFRR